MDTQFAFLDFETTGFSPRKGDKIIEVAIIRTDTYGRIIGQLDTLINPNRDIGAKHIHGITPEMVLKAPKMEDILGDIIHELNGAILIGHNIQFDLRFLNYELQNALAGFQEIQGLCTLQLSRTLVPDLPVRRLDALCEYFDVHPKGYHSAFLDCTATKDIFFELLKLDSEIKVDLTSQHFLSDYSFRVSNDHYFHKSGLGLKRQSAEHSIIREKSRISDAILRLPANKKANPNIDAYLNLLDKILEDRVLNNQEFMELEEFWVENSISKEQAIQAHREYLSNIIRIYLLDGILSQIEKKDIDQVALFLGLSSEVEMMIQTQATKQEKPAILANRSELTGKSVCFTGILESKIAGQAISREDAQALAIEHGLTVKSGVSSKLDILVTADPNSLSGKAKKARELGVRIIGEAIFWNMLGISTD